MTTGTKLTKEYAVRFCFDCMAHQHCTAIGGIYVTCNVCHNENIDANQESMPDPENSQWTPAEAL